MDDSAEQDLVLGVDAGGTRTRAQLAAALPGGPAPATRPGVAGPGNALSVPVPRLTDRLAEALAPAVPQALRPRVGAVVGGFAGAPRVPGDGPGRRAAQDALHGACRRLGLTPGVLEVCSDVEAAFAGVPGGPADGLALVAGTGAVAVRIAARRTVATVDGNGWLLGDEGGGFWLGRQAVRAALRAADGRGAPTSLRAEVARALLSGGPPADPEEYRTRLVAAVASAPPLRLAGLAPIAVGVAAEGDEVAAALLDQAADLLTATLRALHPRRGEPVVCTGGLLVADALRARSLDATSACGALPDSPDAASPEPAALAPDTGRHGTAPPGADPVCHGGAGHGGDVGGGPLADRLAPRLAELGLRAHWIADGLPGALALARFAHSARTPRSAGSGTS